MRLMKSSLRNIKVVWFYGRHIWCINFWWVSKFSSSSLFFSIGPHIVFILNTITHSIDLILVHILNMCDKDFTDNDDDNLIILFMDIIEQYCIAL